jgi:hypothetical protein
LHDREFARTLASRSNAALKAAITPDSVAAPMANDTSRSGIQTLTLNKHSRQ